MDQCERPEPPKVGTEKDMLLGFLDYQRATILCKLDGLSDEELRRPHDPSELTLLGLVKHLAHVERWWFQYSFRGDEVEFPWTDDDPDADWRVDPEERTERIVSLYKDEVAKANQILANHELDDVAQHPQPAQLGMQLRWIVMHMIEETARHCGHADLMREAIDGQRGE